MRAAVARSLPVVLFLVALVGGVALERGLGCGPRPSDFPLSR